MRERSRLLEEAVDLKGEAVMSTCVFESQELAILVVLVKNYTKTFCNSMKLDLELEFVIPCVIQMPYLESITSNSPIPTLILGLPNGP